MVPCDVEKHSFVNKSKNMRRITDFPLFFCSLIQCSTECGSGTQQREVICVRKTEGNFDVLNPYECSYLEKPPSQQSCYLKPCGSKWFHTEWSTVSLSCFPVSVLCLIHLSLLILKENAICIQPPIMKLI